MIKNNAVNQRETEKLLKKIEGYQRNIDDSIRKNKPVKAVNFSLMGDALAELMELSSGEERTEYGHKALEAYGKALEIEPDNAVYLTKRSKLLASAGDLEAAVRDMQAVNAQEATDAISGRYVSNTMRDIAIIRDMQDAIKNMKLSGAISSETADILIKYSEITNNLIVQVGTHEERLDYHDEEITGHGDRIKYLEGMIKELQAKSISQEEAIKNTSEKIADMDDKLKAVATTMDGHDQLLYEHKQKFDEMQEFIQKTAADINVRLNQVDMPAISSLILKHEVSEQEKKQMEEINADVYKLAFYNGLRQQLNASYIAASVIATGMVKNNKSGNLGTFGTILEKVGEYTPMAGAGIKLFGEIISKIDYARQLEKMKLFADLVIDSGEMMELSELVARKLALELDTLSIRINSKDIIEGIADRFNTGTVEVSNEAAIAAGLYKAITVMKKGIKNIGEYKKSGKDKAKIADYAQRFMFGADDTADSMKEMQGHDDAVIVARKIIKEIFSGIKAVTIEEKAELLLKHVEEIYRNVPIKLTSHLLLTEDKKEVGTDEAENTQDDEVTKFIMQEILGIDHGDFSGRGRAKAIEVMSEYVNDDTEKEEKTYDITTEPVNLTGVAIPETGDSVTN